MSARLRPLAVAVAVLLAGAPAGLLWAARAPAVGIGFDDASGAPGLMRFESSQFFDVDRGYAWVALTAGVACGFGGWLAGRRRGPWVPLALVCGGLLAALVAQEVGERVVDNERLHAYCERTAESALCDVYDGHVDLRTGSFLLIWPFAAVTTFGVLTLVADRDEHEPPEFPVWAPPAS